MAPEFEAFGAFMSYRECVLIGIGMSGKFLSDSAYVVVSKCSTGCHIAADVLEPDEIESILPDIETNFRLAFKLAHPETVHGRD
jgi:hypothetical protein